MHQIILSFSMTRGLSARLSNIQSLVNYFESVRQALTRSLELPALIHFCPHEERQSRIPDLSQRSAILKFVPQVAGAGGSAAARTGLGGLVVP
jgi:hypothetical protein